MKEAKDLFRMMKEDYNSGFFSEESNLIFLVSMKWFLSWAKFTGYHKLFKAKDAKKELMQVQWEKPSNPGPINNKNILDDLHFKKDPDEIKEYCNYQIRKGLIEDQDYKMLSYHAYHMLHNIYGGDSTKRYVICTNDEKNTTMIEIWLKQVRISLYLILTQFQQR